MALLLKRALVVKLWGSRSSLCKRSLSKTASMGIQGELVWSLRKAWGRAGIFNPSCHTHTGTLKGTGILTRGLAHYHLEMAIIIRHWSFSSERDREAWSVVKTGTWMAPEDVTLWPLPMFPPSPGVEPK